MLYLENYEELRHLVCTSTKIVLLTPKNILENQIPRIFQERIIGAGTPLGSQSVPLQRQKPISKFASFISELEREVS